MDFRNNRNTVILAFILLLLAGVALLESSAMVVLILLGLLFLVRQFDNNQLQSYNDRQEDSRYARGYFADEYEYEWDTTQTRQERQVQSDPVYRHALEAVERAGHDPDHVSVLAVDIGVMAYSDDESPTVFRTWSLPDDVDYIQPFVQMRLPSKATGLIRFELFDATGNLVFVHEDEHKLERGRNFITPAARLPIHDQHDVLGRWRLRVSADDVLVAEHRFDFAEASSAAISRHIGEDGEINTELRAAMIENAPPKMSLDELLSYQEDEEQQRSSNG